MNDHYSKTWLQNPTKSQKRLMNDYYTLKISQSAIALRPRSLSEMLGSYIIQDVLVYLGKYLVLRREHIYLMSLSLVERVCERDSSSARPERMIRIPPAGRPH